MRDYTFLPCLAYPTLQCDTVHKQRVGRMAHTSLRNIPSQNAMFPPHHRRMKREELMDGEDGAEFDPARFAANGPQV